MENKKSKSIKEIDSVNFSHKKRFPLSEIQYGIDAEEELRKRLRKELKYKYSVVDVDISEEEIGGTQNEMLVKEPDLELEKMEMERLEILLGVFDRLCIERSYTTGELLWNEEWLKERLFGEDLK